MVKYAVPDLSHKKQQVRNQKSDPDRKSSGTSIILNNQFAESSFTFSHANISRGSMMRITSYFMESLLEGWRYNTFRNFTKKASFRLRPVRRKRRFPNNLNLFRSKSSREKLFNVTFRIIKKSRGSLKAKFTTKVLNRFKSIRTRKGASSKKLLSDANVASALSTHSLRNKPLDIDVAFLNIKKQLLEKQKIGADHPKGNFFTKASPLASESAKISFKTTNVVSAIAKKNNRRKNKLRKVIIENIKTSKRKSLSEKTTPTLTKKKKGRRGVVATKKQKTIYRRKINIQNLSQDNYINLNFIIIKLFNMKVKKPKRVKLVSRALRSEYEKQRFLALTKISGYKKQRANNDAHIGLWPKLLAENPSSFVESTNSSIENISASAKDKTNDKLKDFLMELQTDFMDNIKSVHKDKKITEDTILTQNKNTDNLENTINNSRLISENAVKSPKYKENVFFERVTDISKKQQKFNYNEIVTKAHSKIEKNQRDAKEKAKKAGIRNKDHALTKNGKPSVFQRIKRWRKSARWPRIITRIRRRRARARGRARAARARKGKKNKGKINRKRYRKRRFIDKRALKRKNKLLRLRAYPLSFYSFFSKNRNHLLLPPSRKRFHALKVLLLLFKVILVSSFKKQFYFLSMLRQLLSSLLTLPAYIPKFFFLRQLNSFLIKETTFRHLHVYYFKKIFQSRFLIFQCAFTAIVASIQAFDKTKTIGVSFVGMHVRNVNAPLICNYITYKLGQYFTIHEILRPVIYDLRSSPLLAGFRIVVAGRLTRKERAAFMIRKNGRVTSVKKDANIYYAADFKIMRFGVVGVKVWLEKKYSKPYYYKYDFLSIVSLIGLFLSFLLFTNSSMSYSRHYPNMYHRTVLGTQPKSPIRIFVRHMRRIWQRAGSAANKEIAKQAPPHASSGLRNNAPVAPPTEHTPPPPVLNKTQTCGMASYIGQFTRNSVHGETVQSPHNNVPHRSVVGQELFEEGSQASQSANTLTTKPDAHKKDSAITEQTKEFGKTTVNGKLVSRYLNWKDNNLKVTPRDVTKENFKIERETTKDEDDVFEKSKKGKNDPLYRKNGIDIGKRFTSGKEEEKKPNTSTENQTDVFTKNNNKNPGPTPSSKNKLNGKNNSNDEP